MNTFICFTLGFMASRLVFQKHFHSGDVVVSIVMGAVCALIVGIVC